MAPDPGPVVRVRRSTYREALDDAVSYRLRRLAEHHRGAAHCARCLADAAALTRYRYSLARLAQAG